MTTLIDPKMASIQPAMSDVQLKLKACADQVRLTILQVLSTESYSVQELCTILDVKQSALSHHLKLLAEAGFVTTRREGNTIFYRRPVVPVNDAFHGLHQSLYSLLSQVQLNEQHFAGIEAVSQARVESSQQFFIQNAKKFRKQQDLIAPFDQYAQPVSEFVQRIPFNENTLAVEMGPGEGWFLKPLSGLFERVVAFDISQEMLDEASDFIASSKLTNVDLKLGSLDQLEGLDAAADCIVANMVLHHLASPRDVFSQASRLLKPSGAFVVTDLCHHDQNWAKTECGDVWLGFEPSDLSSWANDYGLKEGESNFLAQRNGFRLQIRHFYKIEGDV